MPKQTFFNLPDKKRNHIIETSIQEFSKAPYQNISINHLIKSMGIPAGSFYQYFEDKKDLYFYILSFYIDAQLEESICENKKIDLLDNQKNLHIGEIFSKAPQSVPHYQEVFVDNFIKAPAWIKRDWTFERLIGGNYMELYDFSFFDNEQLDPKIREHKSLMLGIALALPNIIHCFCDPTQNAQEEANLFQFCIDVLKEGLVHYRSSPVK